MRFTTLTSLAILAAGGGAVALPLALPTTALAQDYCVAKPRCTGPFISGAQLQTFLTAAETNGQADRFFLGPVAFARGPYHYDSAEPVELRGSSSAGSSTTLQAGVIDRTVLSLDGAAASIADVRIELALNGSTGLHLVGGSARDISIVQLLGTSIGSGAILEDGASLTGSTVAITSDSTPAVGSLSGSTTISDSRINGGIGVMAIPGVDRITVTRSTITAAFGLFAYAGEIDVSDTLVDGRGSRLSAGFAALAQRAGDRPTVTATRTTVVGGDATSTNTVGGYAAANAGTATVTIRDSALVGVGVPALRMADPGAFGRTTLERVAHGEPVGAADSGPGSSSESDRLPAPSGLDAEFRPLPGSPLIDAGDPAFAAAAGAVDLGGAPRLRDGDGDCAARVDVGAYELQRVDPRAVATASAASAVTGAAVGFSAAGSCAADLAAPLTYAWQFDDGASAVGAEAQHAFATPGAHTATVTVSDPGGHTASAAATVTIAVPPVDGGPGAGDPGAGGPRPLPRRAPGSDRTAPRVSALRIPARLTPGSALPRLRAGRRAPAIAFRLSERASVRLRFARRGRDGRYRAVRGGTIRVRAAKGANRLRFAGRLGRRARLAPGRYRVTLTAVDGAGNRSRAVSARFRVG